MTDRRRVEQNLDALRRRAGNLDDETRRLFYSTVLEAVSQDVDVHRWAAAVEVAYDLTAHGDIPIGW